MPANGISRLFLCRDTASIRYFLCSALFPIIDHPDFFVLYFFRAHPRKTDNDEPTRREIHGKYLYLCRSIDRENPAA